MPAGADPTARPTLADRWVAMPARVGDGRDEDDDARRRVADDDLDDSDWDPIPVPGHWRSMPAFAASDGPLLYRTRFATPPLPAGTTDGRVGRSWLVLDGIFYTSDVWLDGTYLGDTEGYFFPHAFEITEQLHERVEHLLALEVACNPPTDRAHKRNLTGVFQHWDLLDQDWNPGGIWRPVRIEQSGPVRIRHLRVLCRDADADSATVFVRAVLDSDAARTVELRTRVGAAGSDRPELELTKEQPLAVGENQIEWTVTVDAPRLWWPASLGDQPLYDVEVAVLVDDDDATATDTGDRDSVSDRRTRRLGLRRVELDDWIFSINGERLFLKGSNQGPSRMALGEATPDELRRDVALALDAGLDFLRIHGHISRPELYDAADEAGLLLWQDLPLQWGYARGVRKQARRQAREAVDLLAHHPSVVVWCGHNEPMAIDVAPDVVADPRRRNRLVARAAVAQLLPSWNKTILDRSIRSVLDHTDGSRPVVPHSGVLPHPPQLDGTDTHVYLGWYHGNERDLPTLLRWWPRLARFVSEFGAQAVPDNAEFLEPDRWPDLDWDRAARTHALQKTFFDRYVPPADHDTFDSWRAATQDYQATLVRRQVEALRRLKYRPCGGFAQFCFADGYPSVTWSVLDADRAPKAGYAALKAACAPTIIVADRLPPEVRAGDSLLIDIHAVTDVRIAQPDMVADVYLSWMEGDRPQHRTWRWSGDLPPDSCTRIGSCVLDIPDATGELRLELVLLRAADLDDPVATNHDATHIA